MLLDRLVAVSAEVAATSSRTRKTAALADLLRELTPDETAIAVGLLTGLPRQGKIGIGWATVSKVRTPPAPDPTITIGQLDGMLERIRSTTGPGSAAERSSLLEDLFSRATGREADFIGRLLVGELRQGALEGLMADAVAKAAEVPASSVRRALMLTGDLGETTRTALTEGRAGLAATMLTLLRPVRPMLASTAEHIPVAVGDAGPVSVEWKLDGARIQVHKAGDEIRVFTRNLNDITARLPEVREVVADLPAEQLVLDGEILGFSDEDRPQAFQDTMSGLGTENHETRPGLAPVFFDVLHADGEDLIDAPLSDRLEVLARVTGRHRIPGITTSDPDHAEAFLADALTAGHEGVMVKALDSTYQAGRRGKAWRKVKPVHTLDLVVIAAEWGHGRRRGWLSNLHLGARDDRGGFVMVGKTFKGLTDELLEWQTRRFQQMRIGEEDHTVHVRPELVVEIAIDGVQASTRYPGGVALRFARVRRYREDKRPAEADTIEAVRAYLHR